MIFGSAFPIAVKRVGFSMNVGIAEIISQDSGESKTDSRESQRPSR
jgi:hypothetical protein